MSQELPNEIIIEVKQEHIDKGVKGDCHKCMVALALKEQYVDQKVSVGHDASNIGGDSYFHPACARDKIKAFDLGKHVEPFNFKMNKYTLKPIVFPVAPTLDNKFYFSSYSAIPLTTTTSIYMNNTE